MTYIVGFKQPGINAIIGDARVTRTGSNQRSESTVVKTGLLFPGCIFGRIGSEFHSGGFIRAFRRVIHEKRDTLQGFWHQFEGFVDNYPFSGNQDDQFQLLLSTRAFGEPSFYVLDTRDGIQPIDDPRDCYIVTYGGGKEILDPKVEGSFSTWLELIQEYLLDQMKLSDAIAFATAPYCLCLWLSEMSLTYERGRLEEHGVGGVFHFIYQEALLNESICGTLGVWPRDVRYPNHADHAASPNPSTAFGTGLSTTPALWDEARSRSGSART